MHPPYNQNHRDEGSDSRQNQYYQHSLLGQTTTLRARRGFPSMRNAGRFKFQARNFFEQLLCSPYPERLLIGYPANSCRGYTNLPRSDMSGSGERNQASMSQGRPAEARNLIPLTGQAGDLA
jgi:hypothetical protein